MNALRLPNSRGPKRTTEDGFTLLEMIISVVILTMITGAISAAFVTAINSSGLTNARVHTSNDAQLIAAFLVRDAQAAGGVDPTNPVVTGDPALGVSLSDPAGCGTGSPTLRFAWRDWVTPTLSHLHVANYYYLAGAQQLVRTTCNDGGAPTTMTLGRTITSATPSCNPSAACPGIPDSVSLTITATNTPASPATYTYTLQATVRPQGQAPPSGGNTVSFPTLLALGGSCPSTPGVTAAGSPTNVTVNGPIVINGQTNPPTPGNPPCNLLSTGSATFTSTSAPVFPPNGLPDPFSTLPPPNLPSGQPFNESTSCLNQPNPGPAAGHYSPGVYQQNLSITTTVTFDPGVYFFCNGLSISGHGIVTANGVLFYFAQGSLTTTGANTQLTMSGLTSGPDAGFVIWMPKTNLTTTLNLSGQATVNQFNGLIYVPGVDVTLAGGAGAQLGSIIARTISFSGGSNSHVGPYTPTVGAPNPTSGAAGTTSVSITGSGFIASSPLTIKFGATVATITAGATSDANGNVAATFTVPAALAPGNYTVSVSDSGPNTATSATRFTVVPSFGPPTKLVFTRQPSNSSPNAAFPTQPQVTVQDAAGNTVTNDASTVTLAITTGTPTSGGPGTLSGCTQTETLGVITFSGCKINTAGAGYKLHATDGTLTAADSSAFNVVGAAVKLVLSAATTTPNAGAADNLTITAQDSAGNTATGYTGNKTLTFSGATTIGTFKPTVTNSTGTATNFGTGETINFVNGVAQVAGSNNGQMVLYKAETASIVVSDGSINNGSGLSVTVSSASVMTLTNCVVQGTAQACNGTYHLGNGGSMTAKVTVADPYGNAVPNTTVSMTVTSGDTTKYTVSGSPISITNGTVSTTFTVNKLGNGNTTTTITIHATTGAYADLVFSPVK